MTSIKRAAALRLMNKHGFGAVLSPLGYGERAPRAWVLDLSELAHVISPQLHQGSYGVQWSVNIPEVSAVVWDEQLDPESIAAGAVIGRPGRFITDALMPYFSLAAEQDDDEIKREAELVAHDVRAIADRLRRVMPTRRAVVEYLMLDLNDSDSRHEFAFPGGVQLKLLTCAAIAASSGWPEAAQLMERAKAAQPPNDYTDRRIARLAALRRRSE